MDTAESLYPTKATIVIPASHLMGDQQKACATDSVSWDATTTSAVLKPTDDGTAQEVSNSSNLVVPAADTDTSEDAADVGASSSSPPATWYTQIPAWARWRQTGTVLAPPPTSSNTQVLSQKQ